MVIELRMSKDVVWDSRKWSSNKLEMDHQQLPNSSEKAKQLRVQNLKKSLSSSAAASPCLHARTTNAEKKRCLRANLYLPRSTSMLKESFTISLFLGVKVENIDTF